MWDECLLIIFVKNRIPGHVKTRLAESIGDVNAMLIYDELVAYTHQTTRHLLCDRAIYYSMFLPETDPFYEPNAYQMLQHGHDLGSRMKNAFSRGFADGYGHIAIIGSDCAELTQTIIEDAFVKLLSSDFVIGEAQDGGYYLLGMNEFHPGVFKNKTWGTSSVYRETIGSIQALSASYATLPVLNDVDTVDDLGELRMLIDEKQR